MADPLNRAMRSLRETVYSMESDSVYEKDLAAVLRERERERHTSSEKKRRSLFSNMARNRLPGPGCDQRDLEQVLGLLELVFNHFRKMPGSLDCAPNHVPVPNFGLGVRKEICFIMASCARIVVDIQKLIDPLTGDPGQWYLVLIPVYGGRADYEYAKGIEDMAELGISDVILEKHLEEYLQICAAKFITKFERKLVKQGTSGPLFIKCRREDTLWTQSVMRAVNDAFDKGRIPYTASPSNIRHAGSRQVKYQLQFTKDF